MTGTKFWTASIAAGVVLTLLVAAAHFTSGESSRTSNRNARLARLQTLLDEGKTEYRASLVRKKISAAVERVAGLDDSPTVTAIQPAKAADTKDEKKTAKKDEKKKDDKKDKKKKKTKKKKKKKKKTKGTGEQEDATPDDSSEEEESDDSTDQTAGMGGAAGNNSPAFPGNSINNNPQTIEEWFAYLQANLNYEQISRFMQLALAGEVSSEVFYGTLEKMLATSNTRMQQFAVLALRGTPSQPSFILLSEVSNSQKMEAKVRSLAKESMKVYVRLEYVGLLSGVVSNEGEIGAAVDALPYIQAAASKHLGSASQTNSSSTAPGTSPTTGTTPDNTQTNSRAPASNVTRMFETIAASLEHATNSKNTQLSTMSAETLRIVKGLLG